jgi:2-polyprenyl-3-methyl-5-hydroxy-6-metoxy-1,4-benzoquinol methylase
MTHNAKKDPRTAGGDLLDANETIYDQDYYAQGEGKYRLNKILQPVLSFLYFWRVRATCDRISPPSPGNGRALDVGAGRGEFLYYLRKKGWDVVGTQISTTAILAARQLYNIKLIPMSVPTAAELGKFDLITYWHVFEHLENPQAHLDEARALVRDENSTLIIEVPNPESIGADVCYKAWLGSDPAVHINLLRRGDLIEMIRAAGFQVTRIDEFSSKFTLIDLYSALCGWLSRGVLDYDLFMNLLKRPMSTFRDHIHQGFLLMLVSPLAITFSILLAPIGILIKRPETLRIYAKPKNVNCSLGSTA